MSRNGLRVPLKTGDRWNTGNRHPVYTVSLNPLPNHYGLVDHFGREVPWGVRTFRSGYPYWVPKHFSTTRVIKVFTNVPTRPWEPIYVATDPRGPFLWSVKRTPPLYPPLTKGRFRTFGGTHSSTGVYSSGTTLSIDVSGLFSEKVVCKIY